MLPRQRREAAADKRWAAGQVRHSSYHRRLFGTLPALPSPCPLPLQLLMKYRPEDKAAKKQRLLKEAEARSAGQEVEKKKPLVVK